MTLSIPVYPTYSTIRTSKCPEYFNVPAQNYSRIISRPSITSVAELTSKMPCLVKLSTNVYPGSNRNDSLGINQSAIDFSRPLFLYKSIGYNKIRAKCFSQNPYFNHIFHDVIIPQNYNGWFRFQREDGQSAVCLNTVEQLALIDPKYILCDSDICGYYHEESLTPELKAPPREKSFVGTPSLNQPCQISMGNGELGTKLARIIYENATAEIYGSSVDQKAQSRNMTCTQSINYARLRALKNNIRSNIFGTISASQGADQEDEILKSLTRPCDIYVKRCVPRGTLLKNLGIYCETSPPKKHITESSTRESPLPLSLTSAQVGPSSHHTGPKYFKCLIISRGDQGSFPNSKNLPESSAANSVVYLPFHRKGRFYVVGPASCSSINCVYPISTIVKRMDRPVIVKHVCGPLPKTLVNPLKGTEPLPERNVPCSKAKEQDLSFILYPPELGYSSQTVLACTVSPDGNGKSLFELDVAQIDFRHTDLHVITDKGSPASKYKEIIYGPEGAVKTYQNCLTFCQKFGTNFAKSIKIMHFVDDQFG